MAQPVHAFVSIVSLLIVKVSCPVPMVSLLTVKVSCPVAPFCRRHPAGARRTRHVRHCQRTLARTDITD